MTYAASTQHLMESNRNKQSSIEAFQQKRTHPYTKTYAAYLGVQLYTWQYMASQILVHLTYRAVVFHLMQPTYLKHSKFLFAFIEIAIDTGTTA